MCFRNNTFRWLWWDSLPVDTIGAGNGLLLRHQAISWAYVDHLRVPFHNNDVTLADDDVMKCKQFPRYWPFVRGIHRPPVNFKHISQWRGALMYSLIMAWTDSWAKNGDDGDLRCYRAHDDVIVMVINFVLLFVVVLFAIIYIHICVYLCIYICVCTYIYTYIYINIRVCECRFWWWDAVITVCYFVFRCLLTLSYFKGQQAKVESQFENAGSNRFHVSRVQATGLDAWASRVKCPARFVSHLHEICIYIYELFIAFVSFVVCSLL